MPLAPREWVTLGVQKRRVSPIWPMRFSRSGTASRWRASSWRKNPALAECFLGTDYEVAKSSMTDEGWLADEILREEVAVRAELTQVALPANPLGMYDCATVKKI